MILQQKVFCVQFCIHSKQNVQMAYRLHPSPYVLYFFVSHDVVVQNVCSYGYCVLYSTRVGMLHALHYRLCSLRVPTGGFLWCGTVFD